MKKLTQLAQKFNLKNLVTEMKDFILLENALEIAFPDFELMVMDLQKVTSKDAKVKDVFERKYLPFNIENDEWMAKYLQQNAYLLQKENNMAKLEAHKKPNKFREINLDTVKKFMHSELSFFNVRAEYEDLLMRYLVADKVQKLMQAFGLQQNDVISKEGRIWLKNEYPLAAANLAEMERFRDKKMIECKEILIAMAYNKNYLLSTLNHKPNKLKKTPEKGFLSDQRFKQSYAEYQRAIKKLKHYADFVKQGMKRGRTIDTKTNS